MALVLGLMAVGSDYWVWLRGSRSIVTLAEVSKPRIILVPGASVLRSGRLSPILRQRMDVALAAVRAWPEAVVVLSGTAIQGGYDEPWAMRNYLVNQGVDSSRLVLDREGRNTRASIENLGRPMGRLAVVSQRWHLSRAIWIAGAEGWDAQGVVAGGGTSAGWENLCREHLVRIQNFWGRFLTNFTTTELRQIFGNVVSFAQPT